MIKLNQPLRKSNKLKQLDIILTILISLVVLIITAISSILWGTKSDPYVELTIGHIFFPLISLGFIYFWFVKIRKYPLSYLGIKKASKKYWYFIAPLGAILGFAFGIPTYLLITKALPILSGGGLAAHPPQLRYSLPFILIIETFKYPIVSIIPHNLLFRSAIIKSITSVNQSYFILAFMLSTLFYITYHLPFDLSFSAIYFNFIWNMIAVFLYVKSKSLFPPMIFHMFINYIGIMMSWGYHTFN